MSNQTSSYSPHRTSTTEQIQIREDVSYRLRRWRPPENEALGAPPLLLLHGWMDVGASFQRCVDQLAAGREIIALDWRGFGGSGTAEGQDGYWFYDYYADLDAVIDYLSPGAPIDLLGHSMGGNIAMVYAGTCPERIRRLINVEGFGLARTQPSEAPARLARWLSQLKDPVSIRSFATLEEVIEKLLRRSPHMEEGFAAWLARQWTERKDDGRWHVIADAAHKRVNPILYRNDEILAAWAAINAPILLIEGDQAAQNLWKEDRDAQDFEARVSVLKSLDRLKISSCGHMVHLDQPGALAQAVERFLSKES
ncbi:alpha/beta hydrolase [Alcaligenaceae bacterium]|nr:alpha/beta hydrolase [Alcaligenaceae bacterium]